MRRGPGLAALDRTTASTQAYSSLGTTITATSLTSLQSSLSHFSTVLRDFSRRHRAKILSDPVFRFEFQRMCASIGVDPLATPRPGAAKGLWNDVLGLQDWNLEIGVQVVDVCVARREQLGGTMELDDIVRDVNALRTGGGDSSTSQDRDAVTAQDVLNALKALKPLGCGYEVLELPHSGRKVVRTTPRELDVDSTTLLSLLSLPPASPSLLPAVALDISNGVDEQGLRFLTLNELLYADERVGKTAWSRERAGDALETMLMREGSVWIDRGAWPERYYELGAVQRMLG